MSSKILFSVLKYILIVSNILLIIGCLFLLILGMGLMEAEPKEYDSKYKSVNNTALIFVILVPIGVFLVGIIGAVKEHSLLTLTYAILIIIYMIWNVFTEAIWEFSFLTFITGCTYLYLALINYIEKIHKATQESQLNKIYIHH